MMVRKTPPAAAFGDAFRVSRRPLVSIRRGSVTFRSSL